MQTLLIVKQENVQNYLSKNNSTALKGIFAIFVLIHHLYQYSGILVGTPIGHVLQYIGYLSVAMFFFLSGYGLMQNYQKFGSGYIDSFPRKRLLTFYIDIVVFNLVYFIFTIIKDFSIINFELIVKSFTFGGTIIVNGWYFQTALILYLFYYLIFKFVGNDNVKILLVSLLTICLIVLLWLFGFSPTWFQSLLAFPFGLIWSYFQKKIDAKSNARQIIITILAFLLFVIAFVLNYIIKVEIISLIMAMLSEILFVAFVIQMIRWVPIVCKPTLYLGKISLEIYVLQGLLLWILRTDFIAGMNSLIRLIISVGIFIVVIAASVLVNPLISRLNKIISGK